MVVKVSLQLGVTRRHRHRDAASEIHFAIAQCLLGAILVAQSKRGVCAILLGDDRDELVRDLQVRYPDAHLLGSAKDDGRLIEQVIRFVESPGIRLELPLDIRGTAFQHRVWQALRDIPAGSTASYSDIARRIGDPNAARAVARACAANALAVAIPCHRVLHNHGGISGYRWGIERKRALLTREAEA